MLSGKQIARFLGSTDTVTRPYFRGVYIITEIDEAEKACDLNAPNVLVFNTDKYTSHGEHWIGCFIYPEKPELCAFVDPRGKEPIYYYEPLARFMTDLMPSYIKLDFPVQGSNTSDCGLFTCMLLHHCCVDKSLNFVSTRYFKPNRYRDNSFILLEWYKTMFNTPSINSLFGPK